jgi:GT2 family glycosyltransferase
MEIISFVVISYNRPSETIEVLENILYQVDNQEGFIKEIVVVNNGSTLDYSKVEEFITENDSNIIFIDNPENIGVSAGRNVGIKNSNGKYIVFIDDDAVFKEKDIISKIQSRFSRDKTLGIIGFAVYNFFTLESDHPVKNKRKLEENEFYNNIFWGCGFVVLKSVFDTIGSFDSKFFYGMEEYDFSYRVMDKGYRILFTKDISVLHKVSSAGREKNYIKYSRMFINKCIIAYRYLPWFYVMSHFFMWSCFFLLKSRGNLKIYLNSIIQLAKEIRVNKRNKISKETLSYIKLVSGRITY